MWDSDFLIIDGEPYRIPVRSDIKRNIEFLDKFANRVQSGDLQRKIIGVFRNYEMNFDKQKESNYEEYERLYDKITEPVEFHTVKIGNYTFIAYFSSISDTMYEYKDGKEFYKDLSIKFTAKSPWRK